MAETNSSAAESQTNGTTPHFDIPKLCKAAVVCNEGPDFHVEVQDVPVPEIGACQAPRPADAPSEFTYL